MSTTVADLDGLLADFRRRYPDALAALGGLAARRGAPGLPEWPAWCWLPMAAAVSYVTGRGGGGADIARVAALTAWRTGRGLYRVDDEELARDAVRQAHADTGGDPARWAQVRLPAVDDVRLPEWCVYLAAPSPARPADDARAGGLAWPRGVFCHLESDSNTGRPELRLLADTDGSWDGLVPVAVYLDRPTLGAAVADFAAVAQAAAGGAVGADVRSLPGPGAAAALVGLGAFGVLPLLLALCDPNATVTAPGDPGLSPVPAAPRGGRFAPAPATRQWAVHYPRRPVLRLVGGRRP